MASPSLFDRLAARDWGSGLDEPGGSPSEGGGAGVSSLQSAAFRDYLPSVLRLLRDADNAQESAASKELAPIVDKLMEVAMRYHTADAIEEYLCVASDVCRSRLKGFSSSPVKSSSSTPAPSSSGKQEEQAGHKNTVLLFESGSAVTRVKLVLSEMLEVLTEMQQRRAAAALSGGDGGGGMTARDRGETADILNRTSFGSELECLLPVLLAYAPSVNLKDVVKGLLLHSKLAPAFIRTIVQNEPLALSAVLRGIGEALTELETLSSSARATYVIEHAEEACLRLADLSTTVAVEVRSYLISQRLLPTLCLRLSRDPLRDVSDFLVGLWGQQDWFWDVVDVTAVLQALDEQQKGQEPLTLERALALTLSSLDDRFPWHRLQPVRDKILSLTGSSLLPMLLLLLSYVEGLDEAHEATHTFVTALVTALQAGAAAGWMTSQGCVPLHLALLLTGAEPCSGGRLLSVVVDSLITPLADTSPPDMQAVKVVARACHAAATEGRHVELSQPWMVDQLSRLPHYPWPSAPSDPLHCLLEAYEQGLGPITGLHDWLLALLRTSPFPSDELGHHPCLPPLVDHYAQTCITAASVPPGTAPTHPPVQWPLPHELHQLATPPPHLRHVHPCSLSPFYSSSTPRRRRRRQWPSAAAPAPGQDLLPLLTGEHDDTSDDEHDAAGAGGGWSVPSAMVSCLLALRLHQLYLGSSLSFDMPFDYDLYSLPLQLLLDQGHEYRALHTRLLKAAVDLRPDLFQALHLLQEADHQAALQPWADGVHSTATQESGVTLLPLPAAAAAAVEEEDAVLSSLAQLLQSGSSSSQADGQPASEGEEDLLLSQTAKEVEKAWWRVWRHHPQRGAWEVRTLEALIGGGGHDPYLVGAGHGMISRRAAAQEPLLALRTPPWALRHAPLLRITLTVLRSLLISSRMEVACAWRGNILRTELVNKARAESEAKAAAGLEPPMLHRQASVLQALPADGPGVSLLQEAIVVKCLLAHAAHPDTGLEARQECCLFLQDLLLANPRVLPLLVHRGLKPLEVSVLLDGVPSALTLRSMLPSLIRSSSVTSHARALCFFVEFARRYQSDEVFSACKQGLVAVLTKISPTQLQVCVTEGEDVSTSMQAIAQAVLALVLLFPALRSHLIAAIGKVTQAKELDLTARQSPAYQEAMMVLESLHTRIQGPLENVVP